MSYQFASADTKTKQLYLLPFTACIVLIDLLFNKGWQIYITCLHWIVTPVWSHNPSTPAGLLKSNITIAN